MNKLSYENFIALIDKEIKCNCNSCLKSSFKSWGNLTIEQKNSLSKNGEFDFSEECINKNGYTEYHPNGTNYWSEDSPIALAFYPYHESKIMTCEMCNAVFLNYIEEAGHAPQDRIRWVRKDLVYFVIDKDI